MPSAQHHELTGRRLGDYQLIRRLGSGGMAAVYLAQQESLQRQVAFKVLLPHLADDVGYVRRFTHEARSAASLVHANIVQIFEVGCVEGIHFIAQEYVAGQNLRQFLQRNGSLTAAQTASILAQAAAALSKASQHGVVHRDIKPENILINAAGEVKVADFGLARLVNRSHDVELTEIGVTMGTPLYMSPEQVEGKAVDARTDIYSLGVTGYHMLAGRPPFEGESPLAIAVQHLKNPPPPLGEVRQDLPTQLVRVVERMLEKRPDDRYADPLELRRDLIAILHGLPESERLQVDLALLANDTADTIVPKFEATQQLADIMRKSTATRTLAKPGKYRFWPSITALLIGILVAWLTRPGDPLAIGAHELRPTVPKKTTAQQQFLFASLSATETEEAWNAVANYFPPEQSTENAHWANRANQQLYRYYAKNELWAEALATANKLADLDESAREFRVFGIAAQAIAHDHLGNLDQAAERLTDLTLPVTPEQIPDANIRSQLDELQKKLRTNR